MNIRLFLHITGPVIAISLLLLAVGVGAAWNVDRLQRRVSQDLLGNISGLRAGEELEIIVREIRTQLDKFLITGDRQYLDAIEQAWFDPASHSSLRKETESWLSEAERWSLTAPEKQLTAQARKGYQRFVTDLSKLAKEPRGASQQQAVRDMIEKVLIQEIQHPVHEFLDLNEVQADQSIRENQQLAERLVYGLLILGISGSGAGLLAGFALTRAVNRRLVQLSVPIRDAAGRLDEVVGPITFAARADLHELEGVLHKIAERIGAIIDRLRHSERKALLAEQMAEVGQIAAGMAHELRNPLTSMKILVQAALAQGEHEARDTNGHAFTYLGPCLAGRDLLVLEEEITRLEKLVEAFLQFARPPQVEKKSVDVRPLIEQANALVASRASANGTVIEFAPPPQPVMASVDAAQFRQVLLNLLLNALDAARPKGGLVKIELASEPDGRLTLRVLDNGGGIPDSLGDSIFAPFVTTKETGHGLGLSICKRIAEAHGGDITAANRAEGGAVFTLRLPPFSGAAAPLSPGTPGERGRG